MKKQIADVEVIQLKKLKLYLDNCCFNRPFDNQLDDKVRLESEAVLTIMEKCENGVWTIAKSDVLFEEISKMPNEIKKQKVFYLYSIASQNIQLNATIINSAKELMLLNIKPYDALHLASAEYGDVDIFLTTDKKLINLSMKANLRLKVVNPAVWLMEVL